jgi:hypothetical protein
MELTYICAFYDNPGMLVEHQRVWADYPADLRRRFHVIVTDDGSPRAPALPVFAPAGLASQTLYRIGVDVRWNWLACRNLGVANARTEWVLLTDIDHVLPAWTLRRLLDGDPLDGRHVYRLSRVDAHGTYPWPSGSLTPYKLHPNTWLMTRKQFDRIGGYDERFSGYYGSDSEFRERVERHARAVVLLQEPLVRYPREIIPDASTTTYQRKAPEDAVHIPRIKAARAALPAEEQRPLRGQFAYTREASFEQC